MIFHNTQIDSFVNFLSLGFDFLFNKNFYVGDFFQ